MTLDEAKRLSTLEKRCELLEQMLQTEMYVVQDLLKRTYTLEVRVLSYGQSLLMLLEKLPPKENDDANCDSEGERRDEAQGDNPSGCASVQSDEVESEQGPTFSYSDESDIVWDRSRTPPLHPGPEKRT